MKANLFISLYKEKDRHRADELYECLLNNFKSNLFADIWVIAEADEKGETSYLRDVSPYKMNVLPCTTRPTFRTFFNVVNTVTDDETINIICNSDIFFKEIPIVPTTNQIFALTRYEVNKNGPITFLNRRDSSDTWLWKGKIRMPQYADFFMGIGGCDNRINFELANMNYEVLNPSLTIQTFHIHSGAKSYDGSVKINRPYLFLEPIAL